MKKRVIIGIILLLYLSCVLVVTPAFASAKKVNKISKVCEYVNGKIARKYTISYNKYGYISLVDAKLKLDGEWYNVRTDYTYEYRADKTPKKLTVIIDGLVPNATLPFGLRYKRTEITFTDKGIPNKSFGESNSCSTSISYKNGLPYKGVIKYNGNIDEIITLDGNGLLEKIIKYAYSDPKKIFSKTIFSNDYQYYDNNIIKAITTTRKLTHPGGSTYTIKDVKSFDKYGTLMKTKDYEYYHGKERLCNTTNYVNTYKNGLLIKQVEKGHYSSRETTLSYTTKKYTERFNDYKTIQDLDNDFIYGFG